MNLILTHTEACALVEKSIERAVNTLLYIRSKLEAERKLSLFEQEFCENEVNILCNINWYGAYLAGAKAMFRAMERNRYLAVKPAKGEKLTAEDMIINKAQLRLYMSSGRNLEWLLTELPSKIEIHTKLTRDKKGKVVDAVAMFVEKTTQYEKI